MDGEQKAVMYKPIDTANVKRERCDVSYDSRYDNDDVTINPDNEADTSLQDITVTSQCLYQPIKTLHHQVSDQSEARMSRDLPLGIVILIH